MLILVDSNQFIADFLLKSASFRYLLHFLSNEGHTLLLSRLVIEEVENKYLAEVQKALADASKSNRQLEHLGLLPHERERPTGLVVPPLNLEKRIREQLDSVEILEYQDVPHAEVVERALKRRKPFDADGAVGYRDCLLWLSLMRRLLSDSGETESEVILISSNWKDFYQTAPEKEAANNESDRTSTPDQGVRKQKTAPILKVQFHNDLVADLTAIQRPVLPFYSVAAFVDSKVDKNKHAINFEKRFDLFEDYIEKEGLMVLQQLERDHGTYVLQHIFPISLARTLTILSSDAEIFEGVEDFDIYLAEEVGGEVYVSCGFDLRIVNVELFVPRSSFEEHRTEIEAAPNVFDVSEFEGKAVIQICLRAYYQASFSYNPIKNECSGFSLSTFSIR